MEYTSYDDQRILTIILKVGLNEEIAYYRKEFIETEGWKANWINYINSGKYHIVEKQIENTERLVRDILPNIEKIWKRDRSRIFQKIPHLTIIIDQGSETPGYAMVDRGEVGKGLVQLHIFIFPLLVALCSNLEIPDVAGDLEKNMVHETVHLIQYQHPYYVALAENLKRTADKYYNLPADNTEIDDLFWKERLMLMKFIRDLFIEGIPRFAENYGSRDFGKKEFGKGYDDAKEMSIFFQAKLDKKIRSIMDARKGIKAEENLLDFDLDVPYIIGDHMVYAIYYSGLKTDLYEIISLKLFGFIKLYELAMQKLRKAPIISYNSGKGTLDYNLILRRFYVAYKQEI